MSAAGAAVGGRAARVRAAAPGAQLRCAAAAPLRAAARPHARVAAACVTTCRLRAGRSSVRFRACHACCVLRVPPLPRALRAAAAAPTALAETLFRFSAAAQLQRQHREGKLLSNRDALDQLRLLGVERIECLRVYGQARARCAAFPCAVPALALELCGDGDQV
jgi:hypothetical protein